MILLSIIVSDKCTHQNEKMHFSAHRTPISEMKKKRLSYCQGTVTASMRKRQRL